jgi:hypothetical protein
MKAILIAAATALTLAPVHASTLLFFDAFEDDPLLQNAQSLVNWTVSNGRVDVVGYSSTDIAPLFDHYPGNGHYLDLDGSSANAGKITTRTVFTLIPGATYTLTFDYAKSRFSPSTERMSFGLGDWSADIRIPAPAIPDLIPARYDFTVGVTSGQLFFNGFGGDDYGPILDNVNLAIEDPVGIVPVPPAGASLLTGLAGFWILRRFGQGQGRKG